MFEFLWALVTLWWRRFVRSASRLCRSLTLKCYHSRPDCLIGSVACRCWHIGPPSAGCQMPSWSFIAIKKKNDILCPLTDDLIHEAALLYILKGKNLLSDSRDLHFMGVFCGWLIAREWGQRSSAALLMSSYKDACSPLRSPKQSYSEKCTALLRGTFSLWASSHLIKQAQEMSLLADWPCVFLRRPPTGASDMHRVSLRQREPPCSSLT